ncbi:hypothetical protein SAMN05421799_101116 [Alicyclobacillus vulcanalis]|uniref:DUF1648 domain-containing protein n=2 Tax=Alicyclobacillus vulcanalis TaxID=252246 RepID=A0A1N7JPM7_9BACL|nr:hypothetical protein SAMN05421799_101116 [Alicyclobacillus vulcanalis]
MCCPRHMCEGVAKMPTGVGYEPSFSFALRSPSLWICLGVAVLLFVTGMFARRMFLRHGRGGLLERVILPFAPAFLMVLTAIYNIVVILRSGWRVVHGILQIRTSGGIAEVDLARAHAAWVSASGPYGLAERLMGTSAPGYQDGVFRLNNGQVANVYVVQGSPTLALSDGHRFVVLGTPGVDELARAAHMGALAPAPALGAIQLHPVAAALTLALTTAILMVHMALWQRYQPRVPDRVTSHWDVTGQANGWMRKDVFYRWGIGLSIALGVIFTCISVTTWMGCLIGAFVQLLLILVWDMVWRHNVRASAA